MGWKWKTNLDYSDPENVFLEIISFLVPQKRKTKSSDSVLASFIGATDEPTKLWMSCLSIVLTLSFTLLSILLRSLCMWLCIPLVWTTCVKGLLHWMTPHGKLYETGCVMLLCPAGRCIKDNSSLIRLFVWWEVCVKEQRLQRCETSCCGGITHVCVGVLSLGLGQRGVTVGAVVFTEVIGSLGVGGYQQLLDVSLWRKNTQTNKTKKQINKNR